MFVFDVCSLMFVPDVFVGGGSSRHFSHQLLGMLYKEAELRACFIGAFSELRFQSEYRNYIVELFAR